MRLSQAATIFAGALFLQSCASNSVYFYETEKIAMTLEARPDPSQPVQGSLGLKQRVVLVAPKKAAAGSPNTGGANVTRVNKEKKESNDSASVLSTFRFSKSPSTDAFGVGAFLIQSALLTGDAAECIVPNSNDKGCKPGASEIVGDGQAKQRDNNATASTIEPGGAADVIATPPAALVTAPSVQFETGNAVTTQAAKVISQKSKSPTQEIADVIIDIARTNNRLVDLRNVVATPFNQVDTAALQSLTGVKKEAYTEELHDTLRKKMDINR